jgi:hypothetical protein
MIYFITSVLIDKNLYLEVGVEQFYNQIRIGFTNVMKR